ncbi:MAG: DUF1499 domain-containing protein [SAR324 cluster bacterium]|nr:DUF1499 domain-containing protein [SAR324 cluster bacterium]
MGLFSCAGKRPENLGVKDQHLAPCPNKPNCVSSQSQDDSHFIKPLTYLGTVEESRQWLKEIITSKPNTTLIKEESDYFWFEFKSALMGFVDDVEFYFPQSEQIIHVRSASRLGYSDMGANRKRIELLRQTFSPSAQ